MGKHNTISGIIVLIVILTIALSTFLVVTYSTDVLTAAVAFASSDQITKMQASGVTIPPEFYKFRADIPGLLLPGVYVGFPGLMIILSILMFIAGYYYGGETEGHVSSETTTTMSSPNRSGNSGRYASGRHVEKIKTQKTTSSE